MSIGNIKNAQEYQESTISENTPKTFYSHLHLIIWYQV